MSSERDLMKKEITAHRYEGELYEKALKDDPSSLKKSYLKYKPDDVFLAITACNDTVLHLAAYQGNEEMLRVLLEMVPERKLDVFKKKNIHGNTVLHEVAASENVKAVEFLVKKLLLPDGSSNDIHEILVDRNKLGETPLYRAAAFGSKKIVKYLAKEVEKVGTLHDHFQRNDGISILYVAIIFQKFDTAIWLLKKDENLATYKDKEGRTCLHLLASMPTAFYSTCQMKIMRRIIYKCLPDNDGDDRDDNDGSDSLISNVHSKDLECGQSGKSVYTYFKNKMYSCFWRCAKEWKTIRNVWEKKKMNASAVMLMKMLVRKDESWLVPHEAKEDSLICLDREEDDKQATKAKEDRLSCLCREKDGKQATGPKKSRSWLSDTPLLIAARTGILEIVDEFLKVYPQAVQHINQYGQNILHLAIMHRHYEIFDLVQKKDKEIDRLLLGIDNDGCSILHHASLMEFYTGGTSSTVALKLQEELQRFKDIQKQLPPSYTMHLNKENFTAKALFNSEHEKQHEEAQEWVKNTSQSCSTVAILVASVVFTAAYTAPGGYLATGKPLLEDKPLYSFFTVMDVGGLASSLTSVVIFLSVLTSSLEIDDFLLTIPRKLSLGFIFLFFSVSTTMLTFTATILLLIHLEKKWTTSLTYAAAFLPICVFALFQFPLYYEYTAAAIRITPGYVKMILPGNWDSAPTKQKQN